MGPSLRSPRAAAFVMARSIAGRTFRTVFRWSRHSAADQRPTAGRRLKAASDSPATSCRASARIASSWRRYSSSSGCTFSYTAAPWHFLNFLPLPQGHGSLRPTPAYGLATTEAPTAAGPKRLPRGRGSPDGSGPDAVPLTSPSAAALLATIGVARRGGAPPGGPGRVRGGRGPRGGARAGTSGGTRS